MRFCVLLLFVSAFVASSSAQSAKDEVIANDGNWRVQRAKDAMTDEVLCIAFFKKDDRFQLGAKSFFISYRGLGGVDTYRIRFDDEEPTERRVATPVEQRVSAVRFTQPEVKRLVKAKRLRVTTFTLLGRVRDEDIELSGIASAHAVLESSKCK